MSQEKAIDYNKYLSKEYAYYEDIPVVRNEYLNDKSMQTEYLIYCNCGKKYRTYADTSKLSLDSAAPFVSCPFCKRNIQDKYAYSFHSGGCFNALVVCGGNHDN